jgi:excisionase family DNA binding protein
MSSTAIEPAYFSVLELASYLGVSRRTAYTLVHTGAVPSVRVGGQYRIPRAELERRLAARPDRHANFADRSPFSLSTEVARLRAGIWHALDAFEGGDPRLACNLLLALVEDGPDIREAA